MSPVPGEAEGMERTKKNQNWSKTCQVDGEGAGREKVRGGKKKPDKDFPPPPPFHTPRSEFLVRKFSGCCGGCILQTLGAIPVDSCLP